MRGQIALCDKDVWLPTLSSGGVGGKKIGEPEEVLATAGPHVEHVLSVAQCLTILSVEIPRLLRLGHPVIQGREVPALGLVAFFGSPALQ